MNLYPMEYYCATYIFTALWISLFWGIILLGRKSERVNYFKGRMLKNWKPSLIMAVVTYISYYLGRIDTFGLTDLRYFINPFCMFIIGITIVQSIEGFEAFPAIGGIVLHKKVISKSASLLFFSVALAIMILISNSITSIGMNSSTEIAEHLLSIKSKWLLFFTFFSGAGIMEETLFRLVLLSSILKLTRKPWVAIIISALVFGIYHLTPIDAMYRVYWDYPIRKMISVSVAGVIFGIFYVKKGFETTVIGHVLSNWIPLLLFIG